MVHTACCHPAISTRGNSAKHPKFLILHRRNEFVLAYDRTRFALRLRIHIGESEHETAIWIGLPSKPRYVTHHIRRHPCRGSHAWRLGRQCTTQLGYRIRRFRIRSRCPRHSHAWNGKIEAAVMRRVSGDQTRQSDYIHWRSGRIEFRVCAGGSAGSRLHCRYASLWIVTDRFPFGHPSARSWKALYREGGFLAV